MATNDELLERIRIDPNERHVNLQLMREAANDEFFLADLNTAMEDFRDAGSPRTSPMNSWTR
ncbi:MAG: hypothetical protein ABJB61_02340 [bacterium]